MPAWTYTDSDERQWRPTASADGWPDRDTWCVGNCMGGARRRVRDYETAIVDYQAAHAAWQKRPRSEEDPEPVKPEPPRIVPTYGDPVYCGMDVYDIKGKLSRLDGMACVYAREADGMRGASEEARVSGSTEAKSLSPIVEDLDELDGWLRSWKAVYLDVESFARQGTLADSITLGTAWLVARAERILGRRDVAHEFGQEVEGWYARLARFDASNVVVHRKPLRCPGCSRLSLEWREGENRVTCRTRDCTQGSITLAEYEAMVDATAGIVRREVKQS